MSGPKFLAASVAFLCAIGVYLAWRHFDWQLPVESARSIARKIIPSVPWVFNAGVGGTAKPVTTPSNSGDFVGCVEQTSPTTKNARQRATACSKALQSGSLTPAEVAIARFNRAVARMALGNRVLASSDYLEALKYYDNAIDPSAPDALALYRRASALDALGHGDQALALYNEAIKTSPQEPAAYFARAVMLAGRERSYDRAIEDFDKVLALVPDSVDTLLHRGDAYSQTGNFARALADQDRAIALAPDNVQARVFRGLTNNRRGEQQLALADYDAALKIDPDNVDALVDRAAIYATDGKPKRALADFNAALAVEPDNPTALYNRGYVHFSLRDYDQALGDYDAAIALDPTMALAYNNRCLVRAIVGRELVKALADCDTALKLAPLNLDVRETRGFVYLKLGEPAIAIKEYDAAIAIDPNQVIALYGRGLARLRMGNAREGEADQAAAKAVDPTVERQFSIYGLS